MLRRMGDWHAAAFCVQEFLNHTHTAAMPTNVGIDDDLVAGALKANGCKTKKAAMEQGLRLLVRIRPHETERGLRPARYSSAKGGVGADDPVRRKAVRFLSKSPDAE